MSMARFSSGKWHLQKLPPDDWDAEPGYRIMADSTLFLTLTPCSDGYTPGENEANARLIVTAPRLYELMGRMQEMIRYPRVWKDADRIAMINECEALLREAREGPP